VTTSEQSTARLVAVDDLDASQVAVVEKTRHGALAVGISAGKPFAVSNRCRHLFASLGKGG
jgi:nitrite reductase/ring-hydroxylating ferredoxin subunit